MWMRRPFLRMERAWVFFYVEGRNAAGRGAGGDETAGRGNWQRMGSKFSGVAVAAVDAAKPAAPALVTPADLHVYEFDWSPDSKGLAYMAADPPGENNWWGGEALHGDDRQRAESDSRRLRRWPGPLHGLQIAVPRWSPDGRAIAFIGGLMSDQGSTGGDVWIVSAAGGAPRNLSQGRPPRRPGSSGQATSICT